MVVLVMTKVMKHYQTVKINESLMFYGLNYIVQLKGKDSQM